MGAKTSKSANITTSPKKEALPAEGQNEETHLNGDAPAAKEEIIKEANTTVNQVIEVAKEEVQEIVNEAKEALKEGSNEAKEIAKEVLNATAEESKTPAKEGESGGKKKVQKKFSFRGISFLRKEKKVKEDKHKNGDATGTPEKKEDETPVEEVQESTPAEVTAEEIKAEEIVATEGSTETAAVVTNGEPEVEATEKPKEESDVPAPAAVVEPPTVPELPKVDEEKNELADLVEAFHGTLKISENGVTETTEKIETRIESKIESMTTVVTSSTKEVFSEVVSSTVTENGVHEHDEEEEKKHQTNGTEVVVAE